MGLKLRHTARAMGLEVLRRLGLRRPGVEDRTHQHGVLDLAISHVDMARVIVGGKRCATLTLYTADGDYRLTIRSRKKLRYELETPIIPATMATGARQMPDENEPEIIDLTKMRNTPILNRRDLQLSVNLTREELAEFAKRQVEVFDEMDKLEIAEKARSAAWRVGHKSRQSVHRDLVEIVTKEAEVRSVEVVDFALMDLNQCLTVRADTGEVRNRRALNAKEVDKLAQQSLALPAAEGGPVLTPPFNPKDVGPGETTEGYAAALAAGTIEERPPRPKKARDMVAYIADGWADDALDALKADTRKSVMAAVKARGEVLKANELPPEAGEPAPEENL